MPHASRQGAALLLVLVIGSVLLLGLAALVGTALTEHRGAERAALASAAFHLAEAGVDRTTRTILEDSFTQADSGWTTPSTDTFTRTFAADSASLGDRAGGYAVVVRRNGITYTVSSRGWVRNNGATLRVARAVEVVFQRLIGPSGVGSRSGCIALTTFSASSTGAASISATQVGPAFDSYVSANNAAPGVGNRDNNVLIGTLSAENNAFSLGNGSYLATVATGSSAANPAPTVTTATNASPPYNPLAKIDDPATETLATVEYNAALVRHDLDFTVDPVVPPDAPAQDGWFQALPKDGAAQSQWKLNGKLSDFNPATNVVSTHITKSGNTITIGTSDADKHYIATTSMDNISTLDISGEVILVCLGPINASNGLTVNYRTAGAKLTIYSAGQISGVIKTRQLNAAGALVANHEAKRLAIGLLPGNHNLNMASLEPATINARVAAATQSPTAGASVIMNFGDQDTFVGQIHAPYSAVQLSAVGQVGKLSDYCGSLLARTISITGSNGFAFHYDESLGQSNSGSSAPTLSRTSWRQLQPVDPVFN